MKDIIDIFSAQYPGIINYTPGTSVEVTGSTANIAFAYDKCLDALKKVADTLQWYWTIDGSGVLQFHPNTGGASPVNHYFTIGKDIDSLEVEERSENIVNKYMLKYASGTQPSSDATSQTANGLRELYEDKSTSINDAGTATTEADNYIALNKNAKRRIVLVVNSEYNIESVHPGHLVTVRNLDFSITALKVVRTDYSMDKLRIELEESRTFSEQVFS